MRLRLLIGVVGGRRHAETTLHSRSAARRLRLTLGLEVALLTAATVVALTASHATDALIALIALAMGLRNGTVRKLAVPDATTTVLTSR